MDEEVRDRIRRTNPWALKHMAEKLYEAYKRGYWRPSEEELELLQKIASELKQMWKCKPMNDNAEGGAEKIYIVEFSPLIMRKGELIELVVKTSRSRATQIVAITAAATALAVFLYPALLDVALGGLLQKVVPPGVYNAIHELRHLLGIPCH